MSRRRGYARVVVAGVGFLAALQAAPVRGQERGPVPSLRADAPLVRKLAAARDYLKSESWAEATHLLRGLLDSPEDTLVLVKPPGKDGKEVAAWTGLRAEAARLLGTLPP